MPGNHSYRRTRHSRISRNPPARRENRHNRCAQTTYWNSESVAPSLRDQTKLPDLTGCPVFGGRTQCCARTLPAPRRAPHQSLRIAGGGSAEESAYDARSVPLPNPNLSKTTRASLSAGLCRNARTHAWCIRLRWRAMALRGGLAGSVSAPRWRRGLLDARGAHDALGADGAARGLLK
jgi:hypothetical protein